MATRVLRRAYMECRCLCWEINRRLRQAVTVSTKRGMFTMLLAAEESIGRMLYCTRECELELMWESMAFLRSVEKCPPKGEGCIVDVGANNGLISIGMLQVRELERAIALEPEPRNLSVLQHNVNQNGLVVRAICLPYAVTGRERRIQLELSDRNFGDHRVRANPDAVDSAGSFNESRRRTITIESIRLDNLLDRLLESFTRKIAVVWVDVQGCEGHEFLGARKLLSKGVPVISGIWPYGIVRAGMSQEEFCDIATGIWPS